MTDPRAFLADVAKALEDNAFGVAGAVRSQEGGAVFVDKSEVPRPRLVPHAELARLAAAHAAAPDAAAKNALVECACRAYAGRADCPLVLAVRRTSRGRHQRSDAAKISRNGARAAEIPSSPPRNVDAAAAASPRHVSADYPRPTRGAAATRLRGLSTSHPRRRRDTSAADVGRAERPNTATLQVRRRRGGRAERVGGREDETLAAALAPREGQSQTGHAPSGRRPPALGRAVAKRRVSFVRACF